MAQNTLIQVGDKLSLRLATGEMIVATVQQLDVGHERPDVLMTTQSKWPRWSGSQADIIDLIANIRSLVAQSASTDASVEISVEKKDGEKFIYSNQEALQRDFSTLVHSKDYLRLRSINSIQANVGPVGEMQLSANFVLQSREPGAVLVVSGADKVVAEGLKANISRVIAEGKPRLPAPNFIVMYLIGAAFGWLYAAAFYNINFSFLPEGWPGNLILGVFYILGYGGIFYLLFIVPRSLFPPLRLVKVGTKTTAQVWLPRLYTATGAIAAAALPFLIANIFHVHT
jgi:hypothetical protein